MVVAIVNLLLTLARCATNIWHMEQSNEILRLDTQHRTYSGRDGEGKWWVLEGVGDVLYWLK